MTVLSMLGVLAHGLFVLQVAAQGLSLLVARRVDIRRFVPAGVVAVATAALLFRSGADYVANWVPPLSVNQLVDAGTLLLNPVGVLGVAVGLIAVAGAHRQIERSAKNRDDQWIHLVPVFWAAGPVAALMVLSLARPYFLPRYLVASLPAIAILVAAGANDLDRRVRSWLPARSRDLAWGPVFAVVVFAMVIGQVITHRDRNQDWRSAALLLATEAKSGDAVLFTQQDLKLPFDVAWLEIDGRPDPAPPSIRPVQALGQLHRFADVPADDELTEMAADADRLWVVHQRLVSSGDTWLTVTLSSSVIDDEFAEVQRWHLPGQVQVVLLRRAAP